MMNGRNINEENSVFKNKTGRTALLERAFFLKESYNPSSVAERNAKNNHIGSIFNVLEEQRVGRHALAGVTAVAFVEDSF